MDLPRTVELKGIPTFFITLTQDSKDPRVLKHLQETQMVPKKLILSRFSDDPSSIPPKMIEKMSLEGLISYEQKFKKFMQEVV